MTTTSHNWERVKSEHGPDLKLFKARFDYMKNPRNGKTERMIVLESTDSANVVALTPEQEILFVRQYRFGTGEVTIELPGGLVDSGEEHAEAAKRELREETGYTGHNWQFLGSIASNPVFMDSYIHHWLVEEVTLSDHMELDDGELVEVIKMPKEEAYQKLQSGFFQHPHTVNALFRFFYR